MKMQINVEKRYAVLIFVGLLILAGTWVAYAVDTSKGWHSANEIDWSEEILDGVVVKGLNAEQGWLGWRYLIRFTNSGASMIRDNYGLGLGLGGSSGFFWANLIDEYYSMHLSKEGDLWAKNSITVGGTDYNNGVGVCLADGTNCPSTNVQSEHNDCYWTGYFSEEGSANAICSIGTYVAGVRCRGEYCDDISLYCCKPV